MLTVRGTFRNGVVEPEEPVEGREGQSVAITFLEPNGASSNGELSPEVMKAGWDELLRIVDDCQIETGIPDLAAEHDHYAHGKPKRGS